MVTGGKVGRGAIENGKGGGVKYLVLEGDPALSDDVL